MRYRLRPLLAILTGLCLFMGYECDWIMKRRAFRAQHRDGYMESGHPKYEDDPFKETAPFGLWLFGEKGVSSFEVRIKNELIIDDSGGLRHGDYDAAMKRYIRTIYRLFPEATIYGADENGDVFENATYVAEYDK